MPLDINMLRAHSGGNPDAVKESQRRRFASVELVDEIIAKDEEWRSSVFDVDNLKKEKNKAQKEVGVKMKAKEACVELVAKVKSIAVEIEAAENKQKELKIWIDKNLGTIGNIVASDVPTGNDEDDKHNGNRVERTWGTPRAPEGLLNHHDLLWRIGGYEPERGSAVAGHRGYFLRDMGVMLNQAFQNYGIAFLRKRDYIPLSPPYMMNKSVMTGVAQLEQFDEELYKVDDGSEEGKYLIATSEQPICAFHKDDWMNEKELPIKYAGVSTCFRKEAGSHGRDTWGIFRVHQFEKVEQFVIVEGDLEKSEAMQDDMIKAAEEFYQSLGFPYQVINIVSGALNNAAAKKLDLECWFPGYNSYRELVSCSNCTDYQSRAMEVRSGLKKLGDREKKYVHMLNSTLCATGRAICCLLETYQEADGVRIPEVLVPFMGGITFMPFVRDSKLNPLPAPSDKSDKTKAPKNKEGGKKDETKKDDKITTKTADADAKKDSKDNSKDNSKDSMDSKTKKEDKGKTTKGPTPAAAPVPVVKSDDPLQNKLDEQAAKVRILKTEKADKALITAAVDELLSIKKEMSERDGTSAPPAQKVDQKAIAKAKKEADKAKAKAEEEQAVKKGAQPEREFVPCQPPAVPVLAPKYVTPAPSTSITTKSTTTTTTTGALDLKALDNVLLDFSYVGGYMPTKKDSEIIDELRTSGQDKDITGYVNVARWWKNVNSFSPDEKALWK